MRSPRRRPGCTTSAIRLKTFVSDVSDASVLAETAREIDAKFGPLHIVCNNAGVAMPGHAAGRKFRCRTGTG